MNANILTMDPTKPTAQALALLDNKIVGVGSNEEISAIIGQETMVTDLKDATVLPGFTDCHIHLIEYGLGLRTLELRDVHSIEEMKDRITRKVGDSEPWILGRGWDQEKFVEKRYPTRQDLDEVSPNKPVSLRRVCGHICVTNSAALDKAGITAQSPDPEGGVIDRDLRGEPTGILRENAVQLVEKEIPSPSLEDYEQAVLAACEKALEAGLTMVHCIISSQNELRALLKLRAEGRLPLRFYVLIPTDQLNTAKQLGLRTGFGDEWVRIGALKIFTDGSLGARTAALEAPYGDDPLNRGVTIYSQEQLDEIITDAHRSDFQVAVHAIGDRAVKMALEALMKATSWMPKINLRHRIEHASVLNPELIQKLSRSGFIASVQPHFVASDVWVVQRLGSKRAQLTYPFSTLVKAGVTLAAGSDCPVEPLTPLSGIAAAVNRPDSQEAVTVDEAIAFYTKNAAYASSDEKVKGTISPGKYADLVVLGRDPRKVPASELQTIPILMTIVGGKIEHGSDTLN